LRGAEAVRREGGGESGHIMVEVVARRGATIYSCAGLATLLSLALLACPRKASRRWGCTL
jgi:hypothetical protein